MTNLRQPIYRIPSLMCDRSILTSRCYIPAAAAIVLRQFGVAGGRARPNSTRRLVVFEYAPPFSSRFCSDRVVMRTNYSKQVACHGDGIANRRCERYTLPRSLPYFEPIFAARCPRSRNAQWTSPTVGQQHDTDCEPVTLAWYERDDEKD